LKPDSLLQNKVPAGSLFQIVGAG